jgi:polyisoprenoid-binding protein YceI
MKTASSLLLWLVSANVVISAEQYALDAAHSELSFQVRHFASNVVGRFGDFSGTVVFNRAQPERSSVEATIQVRSIDTGIKDRDHHLLSAEFFDVQKFPTITFKSTSVDRTGEHTADVHGNLTIHGTTRPVLLHVELLSEKNDTPDSLHWKVAASLKRKSFGLGWNALVEASQAVGDDINIRMKIVTPAH